MMFLDEPGGIRLGHLLISAQPLVFWFCLVGNSLLKEPTADMGARPSGKIVAVERES